MIVDSAIGGVFNRNVPIELNEILKKDFSKEKDCYITYFMFKDDFKDYVLKNKSVKGYKGDYSALYLPFDIDDEDLEKAKVQAIAFIEKLQMGYDLHNTDIDIYFTGAKGFHIQLNSQLFGGFEPSERLAEIFRELALEISAGIKIDPVIYEPMRLWRLPNTINGKTGLYKIQLSVEELFKLSIDEIKELAKNPREINLFEYNPNEMLVYLYKTAKEIKPINTTFTNKIFPKNEKYCIYQILNNGVPEGERNNALLRLAIYFNSKFNSSLVKTIAGEWNKGHNLGLSENEIDTTIESSLNGYDYGCNDGLLKKYCSDRCSYYRKKKDNDLDIKNIEDLEKEYIQYIQELDEVKIDLHNWLPQFQHISRGLTAGEVVVVIAGSGVGKSAFLQNLLWNIPCPTIFFSYELPEILTYERFYQIANKCSGERVEIDYLTSTPQTCGLKNKFKELFFTFNPDIKIEEIPDFVEIVERKINKKIKIVAIDYLGLIKGGQGSRYERVSFIAERLKEIAKKTNSVVICLAQVSRQQGALGSEELTLISGKDSGSIENTGDLVLGLFRPNKDIEGKVDNIIKIKILKNRKGKDNVNISCFFEKETLRITELN